MQQLERVVEEAAAFHARALEFTGEFFFEPFGFDPSPLASGAAFYGIAIVAFLLVRRALMPAHRPRAKVKTVEYDFGRNN